MTAHKSASKERAQLIIAGADFFNRTGARPVVISHCKLRIRSEVLLYECEAALLQFERLLRDRSDDEIKYEWANIFKTGLLVTFDVYWYDTDFFEDRKKAYLFGPHPFVFQRFGSDPEELQIVHERQC